MAREANHDRAPHLRFHPQPLPGAAGHGPADGVGSVGGAQHAARRAARSVGRAGHHPHALPRPGAADRREPGHLPAHHHDAVGAGRQDSPRLFVLRGFVRLCAVRRRDGPVLGALPGTGISEPGAVPPAGCRQAGAGSGCHRRRLGLRIRAGRQERPPRSGPTARAAGLVPALRAEGAAERGGSRVRGRHGQAVPGRAAAGQAARVQPVAGQGAGGAQRRQPGDRRLGAGAGRGRVHGARQRLPEDARRLPADSARDERRGHRRAAGRRRHRPARARDAARHRRAGRPGRGGRRRDRDALRQKRAGDDRGRQGQARHVAQEPAGGRGDRPRLRSLRAHPPRGGQPHAQADRGVRRRGAGVRGVPVPPALGAGGDRLAAAGGAGGVRGDALPGRERQHHVAGRHRHRRGRHGGRGRGDDRERAQAPGALARGASGARPHRARALGRHR